MRQFKEALVYDDVLLVPTYSEIESRKDVVLRSKLGELEFSLPLAASPMDTVTGFELASTMANAGALGILHRYNTIQEQVAMLKKAIIKIEHGFVGAAIGVTGDYLERAHALVEADVDVICVDVAHGDHVLMKRALKVLKNEIDSSVHIMAGNVATRDGYLRLVDWGANSVRVGVGSGAICSTRLQTGHGLGLLQSLLDIAPIKTVPVIADGGAVVPGDVVKALAAGADFCMMGSFFAGTYESLGEIFEEGRIKYKIYRGMASRESQMNWRDQDVPTPEGVSHRVPLKGPVSRILAELEGGLRSGMSYSGARTIKELQENAEFRIQTSAGRIESSPHILKRF